MSAEALEELRAWHAKAQSTPEYKLAIKHRHAMLPGVAEELKSRAPGDSDEERELAFVFALTHIAESLPVVDLLMRNVTAEELAAAADGTHEELEAMRAKLEEARLHQLEHQNDHAEWEAKIAALEARNAELLAMHEEFKAALVPASHVDPAPEPIAVEHPESQLDDEEHESGLDILVEETKQE